MKSATIRARPNYRSSPSHVELSGRSAHFSKTVIAAFLIKLAKHMALLACLAILSAIKGRSNVSQLVVLLIVLAAAISYSVGRALERRSLAPMRFSRGGP